jgi:hypothetical protein
MKLLNARAAFIDPGKIRDYLLSPDHPQGRCKAAFFARLGYSEENWQLLESDLVALALAGEAELDHVNPYGCLYRVRGILTGPSDRSAMVVTIWIILTYEDFPRFITAFPGEAP